jgi:hypothetical protein
MNDNCDEIYIGAYWRDHALSAREYIQVSYKFISELEKLSPIFGERCVVIGDQTVATAVPSDYAAFERLVSQMINDPDYLYDNPNPAQKTFTLDSRISKGFRVSFSDGHAGAKRETAISVSVKAGAYGSRRSAPNVVLIELPLNAIDPLDRKLFLRKLFLLTIDSWKPAFAVLSSRELRDLLDPTNRYSFTVGALTYFKDERVGDTCSDLASAERLDAGGVLINIEYDEPWAKSEEKYRPCFDSLAKAGFLA